MRNWLGILLLTVVWLALTGSWTIANAILGLALSWAVLAFSREARGSQKIIYRPARIAGLALLFLYELALSGYRVARLVLTPRMDLKPGIFAYPLKVDRDFEITLLANLITLTPGTLSVDVSDDRKTLFVHAIDCSDADQARRDIENGFERKIMEAFH